jgi:alkyl hydroperoxide reductase subunit D
MQHIDQVRAALPEAARDLGLNLQSVLEGGSLSPAQRWGTAVAAAITARHPLLRQALEQDGAEHLAGGTLDDAVAAAALMGMNNVFYRFRHQIAKATYSERPARLRMTRIAKPASNKLDLELFALAVSALNGCEACVRAHEKVVLEGGLTEEHVLDAVRIAATIQAVAVALEYQRAAV